MLKRILLVAILSVNFVNCMDCMDTQDEPLISSQPGSSTDLDERELKIELESRIKLSRIFGNMSPTQCFFQAVEKNNLALAQFCFENKIGDINAKNEEGQTALMLAVQKLNLDMLKLFLENNASVHHIDLEGKNALHYLPIFVPAAQSKSGMESEHYYYKIENIIRRLILAGLNIDACDNEGDTLLIKVIKNHPKDNKLIRIVCDFKPDKNLSNKKRETAFGLANEQEQAILNQIYYFDVCKECVIL